MRNAGNIVSIVFLSITCDAVLSSHCHISLYIEREIERERETERERARCASLCCRSCDLLILWSRGVVILVFWCCGVLMSWCCDINFTKDYTKLQKEYTKHQKDYTKTYSTRQNQKVLDKHLKYVSRVATNITLT